MNIRFYNGKILTLNENDPIIETGELWTCDDHITYVGSACVSESQFDREINLNGNLLMPSFKNTHTHSAMTFLRSYADDLPLQDWLFQQVFPMEARLTPEDIYHLTKLAFLEYMTSGISTCFDMYFHPESVAKAAVECGFRTVMCGSVSDGAENMQRLAGYLDTYNHYDDLVQYKLGFHGEYTASAELMEAIAAYSQENGLPVYMHLAETKEEVDACIGRWGKTPVAYLNSLGMFEYGGAGFHCVHMTEQDLEIFRDKGMFAVTNPGSNAKLASGIAPLCKMVDMGIPISIGTDGPASNNCLDMFKEMFLTTSLQKLDKMDAAAMDAELVLKMATVNGARCLGLTNCDVLANGKKADMIVIDLHQPNMQPVNNLTKNIVYSGSKQNVKMTVINGKIVYEDNCFIGIDPEEIYWNANRIINALKK